MSTFDRLERMNEIELKQVVNEYLTDCCDDIVDFARQWCEEEHADMKDDDVDAFVNLVEDEVRIWILLGNPNNAISDVPKV